MEELVPSQSEDHNCEDPSEVFDKIKNNTNLPNDSITDQNNLDSSKAEKSENKKFFCYICSTTFDSFERKNNHSIQECENEASCLLEKQEKWKTLSR